ncbi:DoxX family protein [Neptunicella marina]|uniref:DoxX family protein n=1 Tax=Neptunicella marina TaxID=2125989 RepID=A0A8J6IPC1_9ALTE|nr:DoxX family protein [Neptunicella marina]MBC3764314.1 DoxX family protein [Neptunicella marina]
MALIIRLSQFYRSTINNISVADGLAPLLLRLYLAPIMIQAGWTKYLAFDDTAAWFGNSDWGLGLPFPVLLATLAVAAELIGGVLLLLGIATRLVSIPLMITMLVAIFSVHWPNGWLAIADGTSWLADGTILYNENVMAAADKLARAKELLQQYGHYDWLTSSGNFVILNNGIEFAATYFVMLLTLFFSGGGRFVSIDYWLVGWLKKQDVN